MFRKIALILTLVIAVSGCTYTNSEDAQEDSDNNSPIIENEGSANLSYDKDSLRIVLFGRAYSNIDAFIAYFNEHISDIEIIVERIPTDNIGSYSQQLRTGMLSGNAPDIIHIMSDLDYDLANSPYLADLMTFIENDADFNIDDYYRNVIEALTLDNNKLPYIPVSFNIDFVGINAQCPELWEAFGSLETASYKQLIEIYKTMPEHYNYDFCPQFYPLDVVYSKDYIDFANRYVRYDREEFIEDLKEAMEINPSISVAATSNYIPEYGDKYLFHSVNYMERRLFMPYKEPYIYFEADPYTGEGYNVPSEFIDFKPLTNNSGALPFFGASFPSLAITENSPNKELAWEFIKLLLSDESYAMFSGENVFYTINSHHVYLNKNVDKKMSADYFTGYIKDQLDTEVLSDEILADIEQTVDKLQYYASMPMSHERAFSSKVSSDINSVMKQLFSGELTPEQTAQRLQNMMELAFQE